MKRGPRPWTPKEKAQSVAWRGVGRTDEWIAQKLGRARGSVSNFFQYGTKVTSEKPAKTKIPCLRCQNDFMSWDIKRNRICDRCKGEFSRLSPLATPSGDGCSVAGRRGA
jgi:hypothetical protein